MQLIIGPPGSGKTTRILDSVRSRLVSGDNRFRLVVPTATMAGHLRHLLAREGLLVRPRSILTLSGLIDEILPRKRAVSQAGLTIIVEETLARLRPDSFQTALAAPGLPAAVSAAIDELAGAGCAPDTWSALGSMRVWTSPLMADLGRIYSEVDAEVARRGLALAPGLLAEAAQAVAAGALAGCEELLVDGFFTLSPVELAFLRAASRRMKLILALPEWPGAAAARLSLRQAGATEIRLHPVRPAGGVELSAAANSHAEAAEIARRILSLAEQGTSFGQIGIIVRSAGPFSSLLASTLAQFGVPVKSFLPEPLAAHPAALWLVSLAETVMSGWEHGTALALLRNPSFVSGVAPAVEEFTSRVINGLPASGIGRLQRIAVETQGASSIQRSLDALAATAAWAEQARCPRDWASAIAPLLELISPPGGSTPEAVHLSRVRGTAIAALRSSLDESAAFLGDDPVAFDVFWRCAYRFIESSDLRVASTRRDAVALVDAYEARQWEWRAVFVAGLLEGEFPRRARIDPILPNDLRIRAGAAGVALRTRGDRDQEERFLFSLALSRATSLTVLSFPRFDGNGELNLPSFILESLPAVTVEPVAVRLRPRSRAPLAAHVALESAEALAEVRRIHGDHSSTALEQFLQCPFVFFARRTLLLDDPPARPSERLDMLALGSLVHGVIAEWHKLGHGSIDAVFASHWRRLVTRLRLPDGYHSEFERLRALRALRYYATDPHLEAGFQANFELPVRITLPSGESVKGRLDRCDVDETKLCRVIDFKYSRASRLQRLKQLDDAGALLQLGLYLAAAGELGLTPAAAAYVPLRSAERWRFKENADEMIAQAIQRADSAVLRILEGEIAPRPVMEDVCEYCDLAAACRIAESRLGRGAAGAA